MASHKRKRRSATEDFIDGALTDCAVANIVWSTIYAYDKTKMSKAPTSIADFFDTKGFPGKRGMRKTPKANLEFALMADGVAPGDVYDVLGTPEGDWVSMAIPAGRQRGGPMTSPRQRRSRRTLNGPLIL